MLIEKLVKGVNLISVALQRTNDYHKKIRTKWYGSTFFYDFCFFFMIMIKISEVVVIANMGIILKFVTGLFKMQF